VQPTFDFSLVALVASDYKSDATSAFYREAFYRPKAFYFIMILISHLLQF
jgi:hypothetical protein